MQKTDVELLIEKTIELYKSKLNAKIAEVDQEKVDNGGKAMMKEINAKAYFTDLNQKSANWNPIVVINEYSNEVETNGCDSSETVQISISIIVEDGVKSPLYFMMQRYRRCLKEVATDNWKKLYNGLKLKVRSLQPIPLKDLNTSKMYKAIGITIETSFSN